MSEAALYDAGSYLDTSFKSKGIGGWRKLYLSFIGDLAPFSVIELGAGAPEFLEQVEAERRVAVDIGLRFADAFRQRGIGFVCRDLEKETLADLAPADVAICSDVFEHLVNPDRALENIALMLGQRGVLFSHVPNEYRLGHVLKVMLDRSDTVLFHKNNAEWDDPHFRRFSDRGFRRFLARRFRYNLSLADLHFDRPARLLRTLGFRVPYCLAGGPTYASTNDAAVHGRLLELKKERARVRR
ncbi:MAG TPA: methyltransferase domain-containing protein [Candidatus Saccharimonadales bacterium]|nr:methyltransferase domain-containing protein [Candidatus Saccharimonadales bacterium]